jgi:protein AaeX
MRFVEIDVFGIHVAPISVVLLVGWIITSGMRRVSARVGLLRHT